MLLFTLPKVHPGVGESVRHLAPSASGRAGTLLIVIRTNMAYILDSEPIARAASDPKGGSELDLKT